MKIFANHAHVFPEDKRADGSVAALIELMDKTGIGEAVCYAPFPSYGYCDNPNKWLVNEIKSYERLFGFGVIDFKKGNFTGQVKEIADLGLKGIKMHPQFQDFRIDCKEAMEVYGEAERQGLFISFHSGIHWNRIADSKVLLFDEVAYHHPKLRFSLEHVGGYCFFNEAIAVMINNKRVYAGLTSVFDNKMNRFWYLDPQKIADLLHITGAERCIFGLDFPYNNAEKITEAIDNIKNLQITQAEKELIFGGNLKNLLFPQQ